MGVVLADQGRTKEAILNYHQALESDPQYVKAVVNLERVLEDMGNFTDAMVELEKLVKLVPHSADIRTRLAALYLKMERYPEALEHAKAALEWDPENIQALRIEGAVQRIQGNDGEAKKIFERLLSLDPGNYGFHLDLADIHFKRKEYKEAEDRILAFLARRPNDRGGKLLLGKLYAEMGNRSQAIQIFEDLAKADPNDTEALAAAAELHKDAGSLEKALRTADQLVNLQGKRATSDDLSDLNKSLEFYEKAVNAYSSSVREMWERNIKLMAESLKTEEQGSEEDSPLLGAVEAVPMADEAVETLFIEDIETPPEEEDEELLPVDNIFPDDEPFPDTSLDSLARPEDEPAGPAHRDEDVVPDKSPPPQEPVLPPSYPPPPQYPPPQYPPPPQDAPSPQDAPPPQDAPSPQDAPQPQEAPPPHRAPRYPPPRSPYSPGEGPAEEASANAAAEDAGEEPFPEEPLFEEFPGDLAGEEPLPEEALFEEFPEDLAAEEMPEEAAEEEIPAEAAAEDAGEGPAEEASANAAAEDAGEEPVSEEALFEEFPEDLAAEETPEEVFEEEIPAEAPAEEASAAEAAAEDAGEDPAEEASANAGEEPLPEEALFEEFPGELAAEEIPEEAVEEEIPAEAPAEEASAAEAVAEDAGEGPAEVSPANTIPLEGSPIIPAGPDKPEGRVPPGKPKMLGLIQYLKNLAESLPNEKRDAFMKSDARLGMEYIIDTLEGRKGLFREIQERVPEALSPREKQERAADVPKPKDVTNTLAYLGKLATALSDQHLSAAITRKVDTVILEMRQSTPEI
jgi:tetratricopeptide (TPR) repeat protein